MGHDEKTTVTVLSGPLEITVPPSGFENARLTIANKNHDCVVIRDRGRSRTLLKGEAAKVGGGWRWYEKLFTLWILF